MLRIPLTVETAETAWGCGLLKPSTLRYSQTRRSVETHIIICLRHTDTEIAECFEGRAKPLGLTLIAKHSREIPRITSVFFETSSFSTEPNAGAK